MVFVHELGHFWTARKFGIKCDEFGFGFPPRICGWRKVNGKRKFFWGNKDIDKIESEDTVYSMNWIPLGGFVKIKGEDGENVGEPDSFGAKKIWQRAVVLSAGVFMNIVLAALCLMIVFMIGAPQVVDTADPNAIIKDPKLMVMSFVAESPAQEAGVALGDVIKTINGQEVVTIDEVQSFVYENEGETISLLVERLGEEKTFEIEITKIAETDLPGMGVGIANTGIVRYPWYQSIWYGIRGTYVMAGQIIVAFATVIKNAVVGAPIGVELAGPIGIAVMTGQVARMGFVYILQFTALLSINLAIINFLPLPALDGGRVLFLIIEKIRGKAVNQKVEQIIHATGFFLLILLMIIVTGKDLFRFKEFFINIWDKIM